MWRAMGRLHRMIWHLEKGSDQMSETFLIGALLTMTGGFLDAYSYLGRQGVFANAQTGNLVLLGIRLLEGDIRGMARYLIPIMAFAVGILTAELVRGQMGAKGASDGRRPLHWRQAVVGLEALVLLLVAWMPQGSMDMPANVMISLVCAMQMEAFRKLKGCAYATTMCTGNLRSGTERLYRYLRGKGRDDAREMLQYYGIILCFIAGAVAGALCTGWLAQKAVLLCCAVLALAFLLMFVEE